MPIDNHPFNPFVRGFNELRIQRLLAILYDAKAPLCYLPPHPSQQRLDDEQLERRPCLFNDIHALIITSNAASTVDDDNHPNPGIVVQVIYGVFAHDQSPPLLVGDLYSQALAQQRIQQLTFETGHYSRCWEVSSAHLPETAWSTLEMLTYLNGLLFESFALPASAAIGFKLIATPWTDAHLSKVGSITAEQLRQEQLCKGVPRELVEVLHLAAQADVRVLIFDPNAACLAGLPTYEDLQ